MSQEQFGLEAATIDLRGRTIAGRYRIDALLGEGAMGAVYRGTQLGLDRSVAIKVLRARHTDDPMVAKRFDREAIAVSKLDHRNCVKVLDAGTTEDRRKYIVMEHLDGQELRSLLGGPLEPKRAVDLTRQILDGLEHAHRRGLVHRDLKPENVFVVADDDGRDVVKLVDFGIVKLLDPETEDERLTRAGMVFGTPAYMAPEQAAGGKIDPRTDLYAVGVLLYEMLSGKPPFEADEPGLLLRMHMIAEPPPLAEGVPQGIREVVAKLLAKSPKARFETARQARDALNDAHTARPHRQHSHVVFMPAADVAGPSQRVQLPGPPSRETVLGNSPLANLEPPSRFAPPVRQSSTLIALPQAIASASASQPGLPGPETPHQSRPGQPPSGVAYTQLALPNVSVEPPAQRPSGNKVLVAAAIVLATCLLAAIVAGALAGCEHRVQLESTEGRPTDG